MTHLSLTADQMSAAAHYLAREWGDESRYRIEGIESPTLKVSLFRVVHADGSRFTIAADKWGNCRDWDTDDGERERIAEMHREASRA
jgi:hypothetical protein